MNFKKLSIMLPTRGRVQKLDRAITSLRKNAQDPLCVEIIFRCDLDDEKTQKYLREKDEKFLVGPREKGYASLPKFMNQCAEASSGDVIVMFNDDAIVETVDWDVLLLDCANKFPDGIFNIGVDTGLNANLFPFSIISRKVFKALGFINDERLIFSDIFLLDVMKRFGRAIRLPSVKMTHEWAGFDPNDQTRKDGHFLENTLVFDGSFGNANDPKRNWRSTYRNLHEKAVKEAVEKIKNNILFQGNSSESENGKDSDCVADFGGEYIHEFILGSGYFDLGLRRLLNRLVWEDSIGRSALILPFMDKSIHKVWEKIFPTSLYLKDHHEMDFYYPENMDGAEVYRGPLGDTGFLFRFRDIVLGPSSKHFAKIRTLIIEDLSYPISIAAYNIFRKALTPESLIIFVHRKNKEKKHGLSNERLVKDLESGAVDGRRHTFEKFFDEQNNEGFSLEIV